MITYWLIGPQQTLPIYIYTQIKTGVTPEVNAVATLILGVTLGVLLLGSVISSVRGRQAERRRPKESL